MTDEAIKSAVPETEEQWLDREYALYYEQNIAAGEEHRIPVCPLSKKKFCAAVRDPSYQGFWDLHKAYQALFVRLKYPMKVNGGTRFDRDTVVRRATLEEVQEVWSGIHERADSPQVGVWLPSLPHPTIVSRDQIV